MSRLPAVTWKPNSTCFSQTVPPRMNFSIAAGFMLLPTSTTSGARTAASGSRIAPILL